MSRCADNVEVIGILNSHGIKVSPKELFYNGSNYGERYTIIGSSDVDGYTDYMNIPVKRKSLGFITRNGRLQNYFYHTGNGFETTKSLDEFLGAINKTKQP